jgi:hypothetical protein
MLKKKMFITGIVGFVFFFLVMVTPASLASISVNVEGLIRIAYMNGFIEAVNKDREVIDDLKRDKDLLKRTVEESAQNYLDLVRQMNQ